MISPLSAQQIHQALETLPEWKLSSDKMSIQRHCRCRDYETVISLVNAVANIARSQDHHPVMTLGYNHCTISYQTHSLNAISPLDIAAAQSVEQVLCTIES